MRSFPGCKKVGGWRVGGGLFGAWNASANPLLSEVRGRRGGLVVRGLLQEVVRRVLHLHMHCRKPRWQLKSRLLLLSRRRAARRGGARRRPAGWWRAVRWRLDCRRGLGRARAHSGRDARGVALGHGLEGLAKEDSFASDGAEVGPPE